MRFEQVWPAGPAGSAAGFHTALRLGDAAPPRRPRIVTNFVASLDGKATADGRTGPLSDDGDHEAFLLLRTQVDAVMVGTGTLRVERYGSLIPRADLAAIRVEAGLEPMPILVVVTHSGRIPFDIPLFANASTDAHIYASPSTVSPPDCAARVQVHEMAGPDGPDLAAVMGSLRSEHGVRSLLCEGGPHLLNGLLAADLVDEFFLTLAPVLVGGSELGVSAGPAIEAPASFTLRRILTRNDHLLLRYARDSPATVS